MGEVAVGHRGTLPTFLVLPPEGSSPSRLWFLCRAGATTRTGQCRVVSREAPIQEKNSLVK